MLHLGIILLGFGLTVLLMFLIVARAGFREWATGVGELIMWEKLVARVKKRWTDDQGSWVVRLFGLLAFGAGVGVLLGVPAECSGTKASPCPSYAFNQPWILRIERGGLAVVAGLIIGALLWYTMFKGEMPTSFGLGGGSATFAAQQAADSAQSLGQQLKRVQETLSSESIRTAGIFTAIESELEALKNQVQGHP